MDTGLDGNGEPKLNGTHTRVHTHIHTHVHTRARTHTHTHTGMILGVAEMAQMDIDLELMRKDR